jgi:putative endonuclease
MFYIYILKSQKDKRLYVGYTNDLRRRYQQHQLGNVKSTASRRPLELIYYEAFKDEHNARQQELFYKTGQGRRVLKSRLESIESNN